MISASINSLVAAKDLGQTFSTQTLTEQLKRTFQSEDISQIMRGLDYLNFVQSLREFLGMENLSHLDGTSVMDIYGKVYCNARVSLHRASDWVIRDRDITRELRSPSLLRSLREVLENGPNCLSPTTSTHR